MRIFVGNLAFATTEEELAQLFESYGLVERVQIMTDPSTGRSRGFAFVTMASRAEGQAALESLQGRELHGRTLSLNEARPREERSGGGGSRSGRPYRPRNP